MCCLLEYRKFAPCTFYVKLVVGYHPVPAPAVTEPRTTLDAAIHALTDSKALDRVFTAD